MPTKLKLAASAPTFIHPLTNGKNLIPGHVIQVRDEDAAALLSLTYKDAAGATQNYFATTTDPVVHDFTTLYPQYVYNTAGAGQAVYKPANAKGVWVGMACGGQGGASGGRFPPGTASSGGVGGAPGAFVEFYLSAAELGSGAITVDVGAGGAGGAAVAVDATSGLPGGDGGATILKIGGSAVAQINGAFANSSGGTSSSITSGGTLQRKGDVPAAAGGGTNVLGNVAILGYDGPIGPGAGGGSISSGNTVTGHGTLQPAQGSPITPSTTAGSDGAYTQLGRRIFAHGGIGGAAQLAAASQKGGDGKMASGGGGGAGSRNGYASGAGGKGGDGFVIFRWDL